MDTLVKKLSTGRHPILFEPRTNELSEIQERLADGFVFVKFTETTGGTELRINLNTQLSRLNQADFLLGKGMLHLVGDCELNFEKICCVADIDLATRQGNGYLQPIQEQS